MHKRYSPKFWITFWSISILFLIGWTYYWQTRNESESITEKVTSKIFDFLPLDGEKKEQFQALSKFAEYALKEDGKEKTFLILFQNNMEIRPGGGFIGSFGILKIKDGKITQIQTHDLSNFDGRIPDTIEPPYPMKETLRVKSWKLRDSNYSPDFLENAKKAQYFYELGKGEEEFDAVIGVTTNVLTSALKIVGPVQIEGYPGSYADEGAILALEYQVEKGFAEQGIERGERKSVINELAKEVLKRVESLGMGQKLEFAKLILEDLNRKDIQLYFSDAEIQKSAEEANWAGRLDSDWKSDFLMPVDANLGAYKSDYYMKRSVDYSVDLSGETPKAILKITYEHTGKQRDWMTKDYVSYLRVYIPKGSWLENSKNFEKPKFGEELGKKYFGGMIYVPLNQTKTIELEYSIPKEVAENYELKIQKQPGINDVPVTVNITDREGNSKSFNEILNSDKVFK